MGTNDDFYDKEFNLKCFYMPSNFEQKYPKTAIVHEGGKIQMTKFKIVKKHICLAIKMWPIIFLTNLYPTFR